MTRSELNSRSQDQYLVCGVFLGLSMIESGRTVSYSRITTPFFYIVHSVSFDTGSSGRVVFPILRAGPHVLKIYAYNRKTDVKIVKRGFMVNSDPNYCSLVLINRGVTISEDGTSAVVQVRVFGPATQLSCVLDGEQPFICKYIY